MRGRKVGSWMLWDATGMRTDDLRSPSKLLVVVEWHRDPFGRLVRLLCQT
jgi:hypothetical protein